MAGLGGLNKATMSLTDKPHELIRKVFQYSGTFLQPIQNCAVRAPNLDAARDAHGGYSPRLSMSAQLGVPMARASSARSSARRERLGDLKHILE